jgi:hypothetical protein
MLRLSLALKMLIFRSHAVSITKGDSACFVMLRL